MPAKLKSRIPMQVAKLQALADTGTRVGAGAISEQAKENVRDRPPIGEGLIAAIHTEREGHASYAVVAGDEGDHFYGHILEHGGRHAPPYPFLIPAFEDKKNVAVDFLAAGLKRL